MNRKWKCKYCGETHLSKMSSRTICHKCHNEKYKKTDYSREYMAFRRWLNGGPDNFLLGPKI